MCYWSPAVLTCLCVFFVWIFILHTKGNLGISGTKDTGGAGNQTTGLKVALPPDHSRPFRNTEIYLFSYQNVIL